METADESDPSTWGGHGTFLQNKNMRIHKKIKQMGKMCLKTVSDDD